MIRLLPFTVALSMLLPASAGAQVAESSLHAAYVGEMRKADRAMQTFLELYDAGRRRDAWDGASRHFQQSNQRPLFVRNRALVHGTLNPARPRELINVRYARPIYPFHVEEFVLYTLSTQVNDSLATVELTVVKERDGQWRVNWFTGWGK